MAPRLFLIDGSSYFYRAFYAVRGLSTSSGLPTNAAFGFTNMLVRVLKSHNPDAVGVVFDAPGRTFRDELYADYKATREAMPEELVRQLPYVKAIPPAFNVETVEIPGVEADDVLGTLAVRALGAGYDVVLVTGDKDFMQLVTKRKDDPAPGIVLYDDMKERRIGIDEVVEKFGVPPGRVADVLALAGDSSDNIPGVKGIGPRFASELVAEHGPVEKILEDVKRVKPRFRAALEMGRESAILSKNLAVIRLDVDVPFSPERFARREPDREKLTALFTKLEFTRFLKDLEAEGPRRQAFTFDGYRLILDRAGLRDLLKGLRKAPVIAVDTETTSPDPMRAELVGISLCAEAGEAAYIPVGHSYLGVPAQIPREEALAELRPLLGDPAVKKVGQNVTYDALVLARHGVEVAPLAFDTMVGAYLVDPDQGPFNLPALARRWLSHDMITYEEVTGKGKKQVTFDLVPVERARDYSGEDADAAFRLAPVLEQKVRADGMGGLLDDIEVPLLGVLVELERNGVRIDTAYFAELGRRFEKKMSASMKDVFRAAGEEFNLDSPRQLQRILFDKLKLNPGKRTKTGFSTDVSVLEKLAADHELPAKILEYRTLSKLKGTYIDSLPSLVNPGTGRIHTSYNQAVAATGRLSSSEPNLQNIPIRTPEGRMIRRGFVPAEGRVYVGADYSQIELRVMAHLSRDERLIRAFREGRDIHRAAAEELFGASDDERRRRAKEVNFGILYGMSPFGLSRELGIGGREAKAYIDQYFDRYPGVKDYIEEIKVNTRKTGYVSTLMGRRRFLKDIDSGNRILREAAERMAVNTPIQGSAADLIKLAMIRTDREFRGRGMRARLILQVHDELIVEAPEGETGEAERVLAEAMEGAATLSVPLTVSVSRGKNWGEIH